MKKILFTLPIIISSLTACGGIETKDDLAKLSMEEFAIKACEEMLDANFEQLSIMLQEYHFKKLEKEFAKNSKAWNTLSDRMSCEIKDIKPQENKTKFTFDRGVFNIDVAKENNSYLVVDID